MTTAAHHTSHSDRAHDDHEATYQEFKKLVNMTASTLTKWLDTDDSKEVGWKGEDGQGKGESVGHRSGKRIVDILHTHKADLTDDDYQHMAKVVGYIKRHMAQKPSGDTSDTRWEKSLKNWGHDPSK